MPANLILLRHGQSEWNRDNRFTGWRDIALTSRGEEEARAAARMLAERGIVYDIAFSSYLRRAIATMWIVLAENRRMWIPAAPDWRLNERHYGALQGLKKDAAARHYGKEQVFRWRRGYEDTPPPETADDIKAANDDNAAVVGIAPDDGRYDGIAVPDAESLAQVEPRVWQFFQSCAAPRLRQGKRVLIVAHGNSLRALIKQLEGLSPDAISAVNIATASPIVYALDDDLRPVEKEQLTVNN
ncbi:MAG: 2,3-bisphosphoglycerate-dependent phosphoglycerate mutase [Gammaproteobacteria bacterium]